MCCTFSCHVLLHYCFVLLVLLHHRLVLRDHFIVLEHNTNTTSGTHQQLTKLNVQMLLHKQYTKSKLESKKSELIRVVGGIEYYNNNISFNSIEEDRMKRFHKDGANILNCSYHHHHFLYLITCFSQSTIHMTHLPA